MSRNRHYVSVEYSEEMRVWLKILEYLEKFEKQQKNDDTYKLEVKEAQKKVETEITTASVKALQNAYQNSVDAINAQKNLLLQMQESLNILVALRQATETEKGAEEKDSRRRKRRVEEQTVDLPISRTKKSRNQTARETLHVGSQVRKHLKTIKQGYVAFRQPKTRNSQGDWIQCIVTRIIGEGPKAKYEVQDPEPDEHHHSGQIYKTVASNLILIPNSSVGLRPLSPGRQVLARYPETTTFYNAQVISTKKDGTCKLRFEGEVGKETEVERKLVLELTQ
ncbi:hypothetical protein PORY_000531 [Pneumocystis oryctolagi]|uniref:Uncharacterized protein n=1 Tax=Pneumocystis oryctolagi TaxID=42067 RepID=A0ACB7CH41_9ASCO|nr:hypothetical protein PORY_000531 [Pneumocystis oryctolagi]